MESQLFFYLIMYEQLQKDFKLPPTPYPFISLYPATQADYNLSATQSPTYFMFDADLETGWKPEPSPVIDLDGFFG